MTSMRPPEAAQPDWRNKMKLNESIRVVDLGKALSGEVGQFEAISPKGERFKVTCEQGHSITSLVAIHQADNWQVTKTGEPVNYEHQPERSKAAGQGGSGGSNY
jgi:hypothetical protein